jgi:hypothetical protein
MWASKMVQDHPVGSAIKVHYDPELPSNASIFVGLTPASFAQAAFGLVLLAIVAGYHFLAFRRQTT